VEAVAVSPRTAVFSLDLEPDYEGDCFHGLDGLNAALEVLSGEQVPLTVFVEGRLLERFPERMQALASRADVQLHCYDHRMAGDTAETLNQSRRLFRKVLGREPEGYRAHTYRLHASLYRALLAEGFKWDASLLPAAFGYGANPARVWRQGGAQCFVLDGGRLVEFPIAVLRRLPLPFTHSYHALARNWLYSLLIRLGQLPPLCVHDMHMVDLQRVPCLAQARFGAVLKAAYRMTWWGRGENTHDDLRWTIRLLRRRGYRFTTLSALYREVQDR
jgi:peptidoglycan/xylan/chitin deacetylase (PgdA/CDA1 family)